MGRIRAGLRQPDKLFVWSGALDEGIEWGAYLLITVWWIEELRLGPAELVALSIVTQLSILLFEVPTGVVADLVSRKLSIVASHALMGVSFVLIAASKDLWLLLVAQCIGGVAWTFRSGAQVAWLTDELDLPEGEDQQSTESVAENSGIDRIVEDLLLKKHRMGMFVAAVSVLAVMFAGVRWLALTLAITGLAEIALAFGLWVAMPERNFAPGRTREASFWSTLRDGSVAVKGHRRLRRLLLITVGLACGAEALDRFGQKRFIDQSDVSIETVTSVGIWFLLAIIAGFLVNTVVSRQLEKGRRVHRVAATLFVLSGLGVVLAASSSVAVVIGLGLIVQDSLRETLDPVMEGWINRDTTSEVRATMHSLIGQVESISEIVGGVLLGVVAELVSIPVALLAVGVVLFLVGISAERSPAT